MTAEPEPKPAPTPRYCRDCVGCQRDLARERGAGYDGRGCGDVCPTCGHECDGTALWLDVNEEVSS